MHDRIRCAGCKVVLAKDDACKVGDVMVTGDIAKWYCPECFVYLKNNDAEVVTMDIIDRLDDCINGNLLSASYEDFEQFERDRGDDSTCVRGRNGRALWTE